MRFPLLLASLIAALLQAPLARGQAAEYDRFITDALRAYDNGAFAEARTLFRRAHELQPTARTFRTLGMCSFNLGDYIDALQNLESALTDARKPLTREQRAHVADLIERANTKVGRFRLKLAPEGAALRVDNTAPALLAGRELLLEPGRHVIEVTADGYRTNQRELSVEPGDRATLELRLEAGPAGVAATPSTETIAVAPQAPAQVAAIAPTPTQTAIASTAAPTSPSAAPPPEARHSGPSTRAILGYVGIGLGAAGVATWAIAGGLALGKKSTLDDVCSHRACQPAQYSTLDTYNSLRTISTVGLISGAALLSIGAILLLTGSERARESTAMTPLLGPGWAGVKGRL
jgi:hypothetical protein